MNTVFTDILPFNLEIISDGGQAFRWNRQKNRKYIGVVENYVIEAAQKDDQLLIESNMDQVGIKYIEEYFDLKRNYNDIENRLMQFEELIPVVNYCSGYRILYQDPWETTISFIISANNNIKNIKKTIESMCKIYGKPIIYKDKTYYSFPQPDILAGLTEKELKQTKCGYRAKYIIETSRMISDGTIDIYDHQGLSTDEIRKRLLTLPGVGKKVADCILLYSMRRFDAFPIDVWIKRVLEHIYFDGREKSLGMLQKFAQDRFKNLAGFAQQYLFYFTRKLWSDRQNWSLIT